MICHQKICRRRRELGIWCEVALLICDICGKQNALTIFKLESGSKNPWWDIPSGNLT